MTCHPAKVQQPGHPLLQAFQEIVNESVHQVQDTAVEIEKKEIIVSTGNLYHNAN